MTTRDFDENEEVYDADKCDIDFETVVEDDPLAPDDLLARHKSVSARQRIESLLELRRMRDELGDPYFDLD